MSELRHTVIEQHHPVARRHTLSGLDSFLRRGIGENFLSFLENTLKARPSLKQSEEAIAAHFKRINSIVESVDEHIARRLQNHENEVFGVVKGEIEEMREATRKVVEQLNRRIAANSAEEELYNLQNELDYFKDQTYSLFQENKAMREQLRQMGVRLGEARADLGDCDAAMQRIQKKYLREKARNAARERQEAERGREVSKDGKAVSKDGKEMVEAMGREAVRKIEWKKLQRESKKGSSRAVESERKRTFSQLDSLPIPQSEVRVEITSPERGKNSPVAIPLDDFLGSDQISVPSFNLNDPDFPELKLLQIDSFQIESPNNQVHFSFAEARTRQMGVQTDLERLPLQQQPRGSSGTVQTTRDLNLMRSGFVQNNPRKGRHIRMSTESNLINRSQRYMNDAISRNRLPPEFLIRRTAKPQ